MFGGGGRMIYFSLRSRMRELKIRNPEDVNSEQEPKKPEKKSWMQNLAPKWVWIVIGVIFVVVNGFFVYQETQESLNRDFSLFSDDRDVDLTDDRFKEAWLEYMQGEWDVVETGGKMEIQENGPIILTSLDGEITEIGYAFSSPSPYGGTVMGGWGEHPEVSWSTKYAESPTVGLSGLGKGHWHSGVIWNMTVGMDAQSSQRFLDGHIWTLQRPDYAETLEATRERLANHEGYLAYPCGDRHEIQVDERYLPRYHYDICLANSDGTNSRVVTNENILAIEIDVGVDASGRVLFYCMEEISASNLCVTGPNGGAIHPLEIDSKNHYSNFDVNSDGDVISICWERNKKQDQRRNQICKFNLDGIEFEQLTNDRSKRISWRLDYKPSINDAGEFVFRCLERRDASQSEVCANEPNGRLKELTEDREKPYLFHPLQVMGPDDSVIYSCSAQTNVSQLCSYNTQTETVEELTYWVSMPYRQFQGLDVNNHGEWVAVCWLRTDKGRHLCGGVLGQPGYWEITPNMLNTYFYEPRIDDSGNIIFRCTERILEEDRLVGYGHSGLCRTDVMKSDFEWLELDHQFIHGDERTFSNFDLSR